MIHTEDRNNATTMASSGTAIKEQQQQQVVGPAAGPPGANFIPKCVCGWKNCRTYQKAFREGRHPVMDGVVRLRFVKSDPESMALKASIDRNLKVPADRAGDWKPGKRSGQEVCRYILARHHYTEKHVLKSIADPKGYSFVKPFSIHGARKYLYAVDVKETYQPNPNGDTFYLQCPNVPKDAVKAAFFRVKQSIVAAQQEQQRQQQQQAGEKTQSTHQTKISVLTEDSHMYDGRPPQSPSSPRYRKGVDRKDSSTVSTARSAAQELLVAKEEENARLKDQLESMQSQLTFLHDMVRQLQEEHFDHQSVRSYGHSVRSGRSRSSRHHNSRVGGGGGGGGGGGRYSNNNHSTSRHSSIVQQYPAGGGGGGGGGRGSSKAGRRTSAGVPHEIELGEDSTGGDWTSRYDDDDDITQFTRRAEDDEDFQYQPELRSSMECANSVTSKAVSIVTASKSLKSLPREIELDEDEDDDEDHESLEEEAFDIKSVHSRMSYDADNNNNNASSPARSVGYQQADRYNNGSTSNRGGGGAGGAGAPASPAGKQRNAAAAAAAAAGGVIGTVAVGANSKQPNRFLSPQQRAKGTTADAAAGGGGGSSVKDQIAAPPLSASGTYEVSELLVTDPYGEQGKYTGSIAHNTGMPHGYGRLEYDRAGRWYEGDWKHGRWTGQGRLSNGDGDFYEGGLKNDHKHGRGVMRFADGRTFEGEYVNGQMLAGKMTYQDGSTYEGMWVDGMRHGRGRCVFTDQSIYEGEFREGEFFGYGRMEWSDGGWYEGDWWNGEMHGQGKEVRPDGSLRHEGQWARGQPIRK